MELSQLTGNEALKRLLAAEERGRGLSHAYILAGPAGSGKRTLARLLAAALLCEGQASPHAGEKPCLACPHCRKVMKDIHPDLIRIGDDGHDINVSQARALRADAYIRPNEGARKVYLIENAQTMNPSAQNALLKLLEEGPAYAAFLLLTDHAAALLPTVRSRCQVLSLSPVSQAQAEAYLRARFPDRPADELTRAALACGGILGRAVTALEGTGEDSQAREGALRLVKLLSDKDELGLMELAVSLEKWERPGLEALLGEGILLLRHALVCAAGGDTGEHDPSRTAAARRAAQILSPRVLLTAADRLDELRAACAFHAGTGHLAGWLCAALAEAIA